MLAGDVLSLEPDGTVRRSHVGDVAAALRPRRGGGAVLAVERGFALRGRRRHPHALDPVWTDDGVRMNEGGCDPDGRFWCGSMAYDQRPGGAALYRLDPDGSVQRVLDGVTISNGLDWSPDGSLAYYADTATHRIDVFDYDRDAGLTGRRPFVRAARRRPPRRADRRRRAAASGWRSTAAGAVHRYAPGRRPGRGGGGADRRR